MLEVYRDLRGRRAGRARARAASKTEKEKFAGARATYSMEAMMQDGKALQAGTTHNFGSNFAKAFDIQFLNKDGKLEYAHETSWGAIHAAHRRHRHDARRRARPGAAAASVAPIQVVILPIAAHKEGVLEGAREAAERAARQPVSG